MCSLILLLLNGRSLCEIVNAYSVSHFWNFFRVYVSILFAIIEQNLLLGLMCVQEITMHAFNKVMK